MYGATSLLFLFAERLLEDFNEIHNFNAAFRHVIENATRYRILVWTLGICIVFASYFIFVEINDYLGKGKLRNLFMAPPASDVANDSNFVTGKRHS